MQLAQQANAAGCIFFKYVKSNFFNYLLRTDLTTALKVTQDNIIRENNYLPIIRQYYQRCAVAQWTTTKDIFDSPEMHLRLISSAGSVIGISI